VKSLEKRRRKGMMRQWNHHQLENEDELIISNILKNHGEVIILQAT
jgi:hypothetical protein